MNNYLKNERYFIMKIRKNLDYHTLENFFQSIHLSKNKMAASAGRRPGGTRRCGGTAP